MELWPRFKAMAHPKCGFRLVSFCVSSFLALGAGRRAGYIILKRKIIVRWADLSDFFVHFRR